MYGSDSQRERYRPHCGNSLFCRGRFSEGSAKGDAHLSFTFLLFILFVGIQI